MKISISFPSAKLLDRFLATKRRLVLSYPEKKDTCTDFQQKRSSALGIRYDYDENRVLLGQGKPTFERAKTAIRHWMMFPESWTRPYPLHDPVRSGQQVAVLFRVLGLWWWNSSEIIYTLDESHLFGFAYGTLPGHVECGEELFMVEMDDAGQVWYRIKAFSRPAYWAVKLAYPFARSQQKRFVRESLRQMQAWVQASKNGE